MDTDSNSSSDTSGAPNDYLPHADSAERNGGSDFNTHQLQTEINAPAPSDNQEPSIQNQTTNISSTI